MKNVYTVAQVNSYIKNMFEQDFLLTSLFIKGEVSNCKYHSSGHIYFTLKDNKGTIACVMFAGNRGGLAFTLEDGQQVILAGSVSVYERDGKYQIYVKEIQLDGAGVLYQKYEQLKKRLEEMGMFAEEYKQQIPFYIDRLGVVTAPAGAAIQDIINIAKRRNPNIQIILYPAIVQGEQAAPSIVNGIRALEAQGVDVMIVGRGGGSIEDLWAFNEETVAQAIFECRIPVISAVGHETDTTIADYVADMRAPTPSAAAELAVTDIAIFEQCLVEYRGQFKDIMQDKLERQRTLAEKLQMRLQHASPKNQIKEKRTYAIKLEEHLQETMKRILVRKRHRMELYIEQMKGLSPLHKLNQGFSYVADSEGRTLTDVERVEVGDHIQIHMKNGVLHANVEEKVAIRRELV